MKKLIIIALIVSIITGFAVYKYATDLKNEYVIKTKPVVVAVKKIPKNTLIEPQMIMIKEIPGDAVHALSTSSTEDVQGRIATSDIEASEQVLTSRLNDSEKVSSDLSLSVKPDHRALTIKTDEISGVAGYIRQGDRVDIIATMINESVESKPVQSRMIAEYVEVLQVGVKSGSEEAYSSVTVSVHVNDLPRLNYALSEGKFRLVLRSIIDEKIANPAPYTS